MVDLEARPCPPVPPAPSTPVVPGRCVCRWVATRPRAVRAVSFARRVGSKPGQAPPPPTGTAAGPSGALHTGDDLRAGVCLGASSRSPARPRRRPPHRRRLSLIGGSVLCLETRPDLAFAPQASSPALAHIAAESTPNVARNSPATLSNIEFRSLELQRFLTLLELYPIELRATFLGSCPTVGDVAGGSFLVFCWFLLVRNVARLLLWSCVWLVFGEDLGLLVERNVALVWVCGVCCERKFAPAW